MAKHKKHKSERYETVKTLFVAISLAIIIRSLFFEPFHIPSGSMKETLQIGDFIFVSKASYGYSRYSFPLGIPFFRGRLFEGDGPQRGDIIVFRLPSSPRIDYIKRLIGLPGDRVQVKEGVLYINDKEVPRVREKDYMEESPDRTQVRHIARYRETMPEGLSYSVLDDTEFGEVDNTPVYTVPKEHYFFMGDNRDHSIDSRYSDRVGFVPAENLVGRAQLIVMSVYEGESLLSVWKWPSIFRSGRFFKKLNVQDAAPAAEK